MQLRKPQKRRLKEHVPIKVESGGKDVAQIADKGKETA